MNNPGFDPGVGKTWRVLYERYLAGDLRDYYNEQVLEDEAIEKAEEKGLILHDTRLRDFMEKRGAAGAT